jgi:hypothetical protein
MVALALLACGGTREETAPAQVAPWLRADPRRCLLIRDLSEDMEVMARRCAEEFVRENGYTLAPASDDSTRWVLEVGEHSGWPRVLALREGTLAEEASTSQCSMRQCVVLFRMRRQTLACAYRAVTMSQVFTRLRVEPGGIRDVRCNDRQA